MGYQSYLAIRTLNVFLVVVVTIALTFGLFYSAFYNIKLQQIKAEARGIVSELYKKGICVDIKACEAYYNKIVEELIKAYGLDKPWYEQLWYMIRDILSFNFGKAEVLRADNGDNTVSVIIAERVPRTVLLLGTAVLITTILGLMLGLYSANRPQGLLDKTVIVAGLTGNAFAAWWVGLLLQSIFGFQLRILPPLNMMSYPPPTTWYDTVIDVSLHLIMPVTSLVLVSFGGWALVVRNLLIGILAEDFMNVAKAKGVPERRLLFGHALKSAAPPIITIIAFSVAGVFGGAIITESVFQWNGLGMLIWEAIQQLDIPVIIAFFYISTILIVLANFVADILYGLFDPRVKTA